MSTRMGTPKPLLRIGNRMLLEHVLDNLRRSRVSEIVVVLGASANLIQQRVPLSGIRVAINEAYREGMASSLRTGLLSLDATADAALIVLADQPFLETRTIDRLIEQYRAKKPHIVLPLYKGFRGNPVLLDRAVFADVLALTGDIGCRAVFGDHSEKILTVPVDDAGVLIDVDTSADLTRFRDALERGELSMALEIADVEDRAFAPDPARPQLVIVGREETAKALAKFAGLLDFTVTVVDPFLATAEFPGADRVLHSLDLARLGSTAGLYVVVASRGAFDHEAVEQALGAGAAYVGLVSNRRRAQKVIADLSAKGVAGLERVHSPAGLDIAAETPAEIALSILAEIVAERRGQAKPTAATPVSTPE